MSPGGKVTDQSVVKSAGYRDLDKAAIAALRKCKFSQATIAGKPVQATMLAQYYWGLE